MRRNQANYSQVKGQGHYITASRGRLEQVAEAVAWAGDKVGGGLAPEDNFTLSIVQHKYQDSADSKTYALTFYG